MAKVIGVRFKHSGRIYYFDPVEYEISVGDGVIVETARGQEYGDVVQGITEIEDTAIVAPLKPVLRLANDQDKTMREQNTGKEDDAFAICQQKIAQHGLDMKLVDVEYSYNGSKVVFYFTADERVDFRDLVKDLAGQFRTRIELRQIGVRDEAKMLGGLGSCGRPVCCKTFLDDFRPVSIKMAKEQNLSLSPTKISGLCGRLMCCLQYEQAGYEEMKKRMPKVNREVLTPDGAGYSIENNAITERTKVRLTLPDGSIDVREYHYTLLGTPGEQLPEAVVQARREQQQRTVDAAAEAAGWQGIPAQPVQGQTDAEQPQERQQQSNSNNNRRRRRGGHGGSGSNGQGQTTRTEGQQSGGKQQQQRTGDHGKKPEPQRQPAKQQPENQPVKQQPADGQQKSNHNRRRRRRGSGNGPRPEGIQKTES